MASPNSVSSFNARAPFDAHRAGAQLSGQERREKALRNRVGEFVGNVFYGTLMKEMQKSGAGGKFLRGGRGEEVFRGQLNMEIARRLGRSPGDPIANQLYKQWDRSNRVESELPAVGLSGHELDTEAGMA